MIIKHRITFVLHRRSADADPHLLCRVKWDGSRQIVSLSTGYTVDPERWDARMQRCVPRSFHGRTRIPAAVINAEAERWTAAAEALFADYAARDEWPTTDRLRRDLRLAVGLDRELCPELRASFVTFLTEQSAERGWTASTLKSLRVLRTYMDACGIFSTFDDFTSDKLLQFITWLQTDRHQVDSSRFKYLGYLRWFLRWADGKGLLTVRDYLAFRPVLAKSAKPVIFLTWGELMRLWEWQPDRRVFTQTELVKARDVFCFCCFTGLRYSDAMNLRWADVEKDYIRVTTVKTRDPLVIELNRWSSEILQRYIMTRYPGDRVFPVLHNQCMNRDLKSLCRLCGLNDTVHLTTFRGGERVDELKKKWMVVTTHAGRRTFICNALMMGISPTTVMQWTGHSDYAAMKPYIAVANDEKRRAMALFDERGR